MFLDIALQKLKYDEINLLHAKHPRFRQHIKKWQKRVKMGISFVGIDGRRFWRFKFKLSRIFKSI